MDFLEAVSTLRPLLGRAAAAGDDDGSAHAHSNQAPAMLGAIWPLVALAALFIWLRIYCKHRRHRGLWWDDYVLVASWVAIFINVAIHSRRVALGFGRHYTDIPDANTNQLALLNNVAVMFGIWAVAWSKTSFALSLIRIASPGWYRRVLIFVMMSMNMFLNSGAVMIWVQPRSCWDIKEGDGCWPRDRVVALNIASNAYSGFMDVVLAGLPWVLLHKVQMKRNEKIGVAVAMSMGLLGALAAVFKCIEMSKVVAIQSKQYGAPPALVTWGVVEATVTIIAATIPVLRVLVMEIRGSSAERSRSRTLDILGDGPRPVVPPKVQAELAASGWVAEAEAPAPVYELDSEALRRSRAGDFELGVVELDAAERHDDATNASTEKLAPVVMEGRRAVEEGQGGESPTLSRPGVYDIHHHDNNNNTVHR